jgi:hypothetical protein
MIDASRLDTVLQKTKASPAPWNDCKHESLTPAWWPAEVFPKLRWSSKLGMRVPRLNLGRHRHVLDGALIHKSVLLRIREAGYAPPNLSGAFLRKVRELKEIPDALPYGYENP